MRVIFTSATTMTTTQQQQQVQNTTAPPSWTKLHDLAVDRVGGKVLWCTDDFFAEKENLVKYEPPIWIADKYTDRGKWMDGWESRRRRTEGHDYCLIKLGLPGRVVGVDIDTSYFNGNHPHAIKLEGVNLPTSPEEKEDKIVEKLLKLPDNEWTTIVPLTEVGPTCHNYRESCNDAKNKIFTHLRYHMFPDGGTARLRVYGEVHVNWSTKIQGGNLVDLAAFEHGGVAVSCSDEHFGKMRNLVMPGRGINMGDGWETRRRRGPGFDWVIIQLGVPGTVKKLEIDTAHFKGNFPHSCSVEGAFIPKDLNPVIALGWHQLLPKSLLQADKIHHFDVDPSEQNFVVTHVKLCIYPDGGVSRFRVWGVPVLNAKI